MSIQVRHYSKLAKTLPIISVCLISMSLFSSQAFAVSASAAQSHPIIANAIDNHPKISKAIKNASPEQKAKLKKALAKTLARRKENSLRSIPAYQCTSNKIFSGGGSVDFNTNGATSGYTQTENLSAPDAGEPYTVRCYIPGDVDSNRYFYTRTDLVGLGDNYLQLTDSLSAQVTGYVNGNTPLVPYSKVQDDSVAHEGPDTFDTEITQGGDATFTFRVDEPFSGTQTFDGQVFRTSLVLNSTTTLNASNYVSEFDMSLTVTSNAECEFAGGDTFTVDLGSVANTDLNDSSIPNGYAPPSLDLTVSCVGFEPDVIQELGYSFDGTRVTGSDEFITTDNSGVGVGLLDEDGEPLLLGTSNAIPVEYDPSIGTATYTPSFYPVHISGEPRAEAGTYSATVISTITLP